MLTPFFSVKEHVMVLGDDQFFPTRREGDLWPAPNIPRVQVTPAAFPDRWHLPPTNPRTREPTLLPPSLITNSTQTNNPILPAEHYQCHPSFFHRVCEFQLLDVRIVFLDQQHSPCGGAHTCFCVWCASTSPFHPAIYIQMRTSRGQRS